VRWLAALSRGGGRELRPQDTGRTGDRASVCLCRVVGWSLAWQAVEDWSSCS